MPSKSIFKCIHFIFISTMLVLSACNPSSPPSENNDETYIPIEIPLEPYIAGLKTITLDIDGQKIPFLFDTAGGIGILTPATTNIINCQPFGRIMGSRHSGEFIEAGRCKTNNLSIKNHRIDGEFGVFDLMSLLGGAPEIGGLISLKEFEGQVLTLDMAGNKLILETAQSHENRIQNMQEISIRPARQAGGATLDIFVATGKKETPLWFELDSGNAINILADQHTLNSMSWEEGVNKIDILGPDGPFSFCATVQRKDMIYDGMLDAKFLERFIVTLDLKNMRGWIKPNTTSSDECPA